MRKKQVMTAKTENLVIETPATCQLTHPETNYAQAMAGKEQFNANIFPQATIASQSANNTNDIQELLDMLQQMMQQMMTMTNLFTTLMSKIAQNSTP